MRPSEGAQNPPCRVAGEQPEPAGGVNEELGLPDQSDALPLFTRKQLEGARFPPTLLGLEDRAVGPNHHCAAFGKHGTVGKDGSSVAADAGQRRTLSMELSA